MTSTTTKTPEHMYVTQLREYCESLTTDDVIALFERGKLVAEDSDDGIECNKYVDSFDIMICFNEFLIGCEKFCNDRDVLADDFWNGFEDYNEAHVEFELFVWYGPFESELFA